MASIIKRPAVLLDIEEHSWFISRDSEEAGLKFPLACDATFEFLAGTPHVGSSRRFLNSKLSGLRQWPVQGFPNHLVFYFPLKNGIEVVRVLHGARQIEDVLEDGG